MAIIGIDLGTTNSLACVWRNNKAELIPNALGEYITPSVVSVKDDEILVGRLAKERLITHPQDSVAAFKRDMGTAKQYTLGNKTFKPEELSSFILRQLIEDAKMYLQEDIEEVIISVPAYFNDDQRWATKTAGALAQVKVERIINEPSAAALAQHIHDDGEDKTFLIIDFGGGTLDISVVDAFDNVIEIAAVAGDNHLGGEDFNTVIAEAFLREHGLYATDISVQEKAMLMKQAEICKRKLSEQDEVNMKVRIHDTLLSMKLTNQQLILLGNSILTRMEGPLKQALKDAGDDIGDIDDIILVGGSCKMPVVQHYIEYLTKHTVTMHLDPDKAIAYGCGTAAGIKERNQEIKDMLLSDIWPFTLGTAIYPDGLKDAIMSPLIERNSVLPCSRESLYTTIHDQQEVIDFEIYQGEHYHAEDNLLLGNLEVKVPPNKKGKEIVKVRLTYDINGILEVDAFVISTRQSFHKMILSKNNRMSEAEIKQKLQALKELKIHPRDKERNRLLLARGERMFLELVKEERQMVADLMRYFEQVLESQNERAIDHAYHEVSRRLDSIEGDGDTTTIPRYFQA